MLCILLVNNFILFWIQKKRANDCTLKGFPQPKIYTTKHTHNVHSAQCIFLILNFVEIFQRLGIKHHKITKNI